MVDDILFQLHYKYDHITPVLRELHWLPVVSIIIFKIIFLTYECV